VEAEEVGDKNVGAEIHVELGFFDDLIKIGRKRVD
jgi:hypothetical protein